MWPFGRKYPSRDQLAVTQSWRVGHGEYQGRPLITRFNEGLKDMMGHPEYRHQVGLAVPLRSPNEHGLPSVEEDRELAAIEDQIARTLEDSRESILAGVISTNGMREFVYYTTDPEAVRTKFERIRETITSHDLQLMIQSDPQWSVYKQFV